MRNIIAITYDSLRADHCGYNGYRRNTTPNLDELAEDGISFSDALAPASRTNPSMASIFTGKPMVFSDEVSNKEISQTHLKRHGTIAQDLKSKGYSTIAFCPNAYSSRYYGFDYGFEHFEDFLFQSNLYQKAFERHLSDSAIVTWFRNLRNYLLKQEAFKTWDSYIEDIIETIESQSEPFFTWVFSLDTHFPYLAPRKHRHWGGLTDMYYYNWRCNQLINKFNIDLSEKEKEKIINIYDDSIHFADALIKELKERLEKYDPIFIIFGDHGEAFGERNMYGHFYPLLYQENIHVPFVIWDSRRNICENIESEVSLLQLRTIINDMATNDWDTSDIKSSVPISFDYDGRNNRSLISLRIGDLKVVHEVNNTNKDKLEIYDLSNDPKETKNLALSHNELADFVGSIISYYRSTYNERTQIQEVARDLNKV